MRAVFRRPPATSTLPRCALTRAASLLLLLSRGALRSGGQQVQLLSTFHGGGADAQGAGGGGERRGPGAGPSGSTLLKVAFVRQRARPSAGLHPRQRRVMQAQGGGAGGGFSPTPLRPSRRVWLRLTSSRSLSMTPPTSTWQGLSPSSSRASRTARRTRTF